MLMKKSDKPSLSRKGIAKNKKALIIIVLIILIILVGLLFFRKNEEKNYDEETKYFAGELFSLNHAANMIDYINDDNNIVISPINVNNSLAVLYNGTDNNTNREIKKYFKETPESINQIISNKLLNLTYETKKETKYTKLYESLIKKLKDNKYENLTISKIELLTQKEKENLILLLKKINLTYERINEKNNLSEKSIKTYNISKNELNENSYSIKESINKILSDYEIYNIENKVNNYNKIFSKSINKNDIEENFKENTKVLGSSISNISEDYIKDTKTINENIKSITNNNIIRIIEPDDFENNDTIMVNSLYFNYEWDRSFKKDQIVHEEFYNANEAIGIVEMMYDIETTYLENKYATAFMKDFKNKKYSFVGILPKKTGKFELSNLDLDSLIISKKDQKVVIGLPKFNYQYETNLKELYSNYGIQELFTDKANFTKITDKKIKIDKSIQKININIGEKGTLESTINYHSQENYTLDDKEKQIILNRPFAFAIIEKETSEVLLIGKVNNFDEGS